MTGPLKAIVLRAPFAPLVAEGVKGFETRGYTPSGTLKVGDPLAIVMALRLFPYDDAPHAWDRLARCDRTDYPAGHVLAVATYGGSIPVHRCADDATGLEQWIQDLPTLTGPVLYLAGVEAKSIEDQRHLGDFAPGRRAWPLLNPRRLARPVPCPALQPDGSRIVMQGVFDLAEHVARAVTAELVGCPANASCPDCRTGKPESCPRPNYGSWSRSVAP